MKDDAPWLSPNATVAKRVLDYAANKSDVLPESLLAYHARIDKLERSIMVISTHQAQAMSFLAQVTGTKRVLEIGVFRGFSSMVWSRAVGPNGKVTGLEMSPEYADFAREAFADLGICNAEIIVGDGLETLAVLDPEEPYDLIFIDAQKTGYPAYLQTILEKSTPGATRRLLRPGGLIVADNVLRRGLVADSSSDNPEALTVGPGSYGELELQALDRFNTHMRDSERIDTWLMPLFDGLGLGRLLD